MVRNQARAVGRSDGVGAILGSPAWLGRVDTHNYIRTLTSCIIVHMGVKMV